MKQVHGAMGINSNTFNFFNNRVIDVLRGLGVAQADLSAVHGVLNSTKSDIVSA